MKGLLTAMRKEYVKPTMESEEFVANEYVAVCIMITCKRGSGKCASPNSVITGYTSLEAYLGATSYAADELHKGQGHPRAAGTFPRFIANYTKKNKISLYQKHH